MGSVRTYFVARSIHAFNRSPVVIPVVQTWGTKQHLRYAVTDTIGRFWTGSGWVTRQRDTLLYSGHHDAAADARRILWRQY